MQKKTKERNGKKFKKESKAIDKAFRELGSIDKKHESGKFTKKQHDSKSKKVLEKLMKVK